MWLVLMWLALMWLVRMATEPMNDGAMRHVAYAMRTPETTIMLIGRPGFRKTPNGAAAKPFSPNLRLTKSSVTSLISVATDPLKLDCRVRTRIYHLLPRSLASQSLDSKSLIPRCPLQGSLAEHRRTEVRATSEHCRHASDCSL